VPTAIPEGDPPKAIMQKRKIKPNNCVIEVLDFCRNDLAIKTEIIYK